MAEIDLIKISELPATSTIGDTDELAVVQGGATKKVPYSVLKDGAEVTPDTTLSEAGVPADAAAVGAALAQKANQAAVTQALDAKADKTEVAGISGDIEELASVVERKADQTALNQKADKATTDALRQDLTTLNGIVNQKADKTELNAQIGNVTAELATKANTADVNNLLAAKANVASPVFTGRPQAPTAPKGTATLQLATTAFVQNAIDDKEDKLTFDSAPTQGSTNPVTSGGVYTAVESAKADAEEAATEAKNLALGAYATPTASGSLLTITDGADGIPAKKVTLNLVPHQSGSGDPSPENVRPISGYTAVKVTRTGKNLLENKGAETHTDLGITYTKNADGSVTANGTAEGGNSTYQFTEGYGVGALGFLPSGDYILTGRPSDAPTGTYIQLRANDNWVDQSTIEKPFTYVNGGGGQDVVRIRILNGTTVNNVTFYPMIRPASVADATYEPFKRMDTYTFAIPTAAGTVYGGSLEINDDGTGILTVNKGLFDLGSITWLKSSTNPDNIFFYGVCTGKKAGVLNIRSDRYVTAQRNGWTVYSDAISGNTSTSQIYIRTSQYSDLTAEEFKTAVSGVYIVCDLSEPQTYTLTAEQVTTLLGDNTLWMDADGSIDLTYRADTQKYIDSRIALLNSNLAYIEDGMTASRAYSVGQYVLIGGQLYRVTASIASGATFTVGTNVVSTTVGAELTALN